jgi:hypothetical protein
LQALGGTQVYPLFWKSLLEAPRRHYTKYLKFSVEPGLRISA